MMSEEKQGKPEKTVMKMLEECAALAQEVGEAVGSLEAGLGYGLSREEPAKEAEESEKQEPVCEYVGVIRGIIDRLRKTRDWIRRIESRLQV
jgi:hypothetical protein